MPIEIITDETILRDAGFRWLRAGDVYSIECAALADDGFTNSFSTRHGGVSPMPKDSLNLAGFSDDDAENIHENRRRFLRLFAGEWKLAACWQMHGVDVRVIRNEADAESEETRCDALTTATRGVLLGVKTADCVPLLLGDPQTGACASVHAGWRGTLDEIVPRTLREMSEQFGTRASDVRAAVGPAANACCYEVGAEVIEGFQNKFKDAGALLAPTREGHALIDLQRANRTQLLEAGVLPERIHTVPFCTMCRTDLFFSYRREKSLHGRTGRLLSVIGKRD